MVAEKTHEPERVAYYFEATVLRKGLPMPRQGSVTADNPKAALDLIQTITESWDVTIVRVNVYEVNDDGEVGENVASTVYGDKLTLEKPKQHNLLEYSSEQDEVSSLAQVGTLIKQNIPPVYRRK